MLVGRLSSIVSTLIKRRYSSYNVLKSVFSQFFFLFNCHGATYIYCVRFSIEAANKREIDNDIILFELLFISLLIESILLILNNFVFLNFCFNCFFLHRLSLVTMIVKTPVYGMACAKQIHSHNINCTVAIMKQPNRWKLRINVCCNNIVHI